METVNNIAATAVKALWGDGDANKEPISGAKGDVASGEPYDAGNLDSVDQERVEKRLSDAGNADKSGPTDRSNTASTVTPLVDTSPDQSDIRHPEKAADEPQSIDPQVPKGIGPQPVDVVAREHGGDAGRAGEGPTQHTDSVTKGAPPKDHSGDGDGKEYVKATGFAADGGNFDASNPGAGGEADRLLDQKGGIPSKEHRSDLTTSTHASTSNGGKDITGSQHSKDKPKLSERIKAKLHKH